VSENRLGIGQHRVGNVGAENNGQKNIRGTAGDVGQPSGGELNNGPVPAAAPDAMINRSHYDPSREAGEARGIRRR
jgi:hypothetical protein